MSFVITTPALVEAAAHDVAGIGSSLGQATSAAATPTTGLVAAGADEVSAAVSALFGNVGQEFQALAAQASAFHEQFVAVLNSSAGAYLSTEAAAGQTLASAADAPAMLSGVSSFGSAVAAPYQALVSNTVTNLQAIGTGFGGSLTTDPFPLLQQLGTNQMAYGQSFAAGVQTGIQNLPAELANVPANIQLGMQGASAFSPAAMAQQFLSGQISTGQTIISSLQSAAADLTAGAPAFQSGAQAAWQTLLAGNPVGAYSEVGQALQNLLFPGLNSTNNAITGITAFTPTGLLGDLSPILALPGSSAQSFTNLLPSGSILAQTAQNATNLINALTNFNTTLDGNLDLTFGVPVQLILDAIGGPANALSSLNSTGVALAGALQTGNLPAAAAAILDAPANVTNGFLNGSTLIDLPPAYLFDGEALSIVQIPLGGVLTPLSVPPALAEFIGFGGLGPFPLASGSTEIGGLIPGLLSIGSQLADAI